MLDLIGLLKAWLIIMALFIGGLLLWTLIGMVIKYSVIALAKLCEKICNWLLQKLK